VGEELTVGLRERRKAEKLQAIRDAARGLFATHGFHNTAMREVARVADVGFGTVSAYAVDKAGLAVMLYVEDLENLEPIFQRARVDVPLLDQVIDNFTTTFRFWASKPELSRIVLPMLGNTNSPYVEKIMQRRGDIRGLLIAWLFKFKQKHVIAADCNLEQAAELLFSIYIASVNEWLSAHEEDENTGIARMRYLMEIPVNALLQ
jgi:AcrR family transcriptional regulator